MKGRSPAFPVMATLAGLYVAQAIPIYLFAAALPAIFRAEGIDLSTIGAMSLLLLPWILKFLWAPLIDRYKAPFLGPRRGWIIPLQVTMILAIVGLSFLPPENSVGWIFWLAFFMAVVSATQDIATDGYAVEHLTEDQRAVGNAIQGGSVAVGVILGGSVTVFLYDILDWQGALLVAAAGAAVALLPVLFVDEAVGRRTTDPDIGPIAVKPSLRGFLKRPGAFNILVFALVFRSSEGLVKAMEQPFLIDKGLSLSMVGLLSGGSAAMVGLAGSAIAAVCLRRWGTGRCLWGIGLARTFCFGLFALAAADIVAEPAVLMGIAAFNTILRYMELVMLYSLFMRFSDLSQAATDFTLLSCAQLIIYMVGGIASGWLAEGFGYQGLFALATALSFAGILFAMHKLSAIDQGRPVFAT